MTPEEKILAEVAALRAEVRELHLCITGDKLKNHVGVMDILETHRRELYGNEATKDIGLKERQSIDHGRLKVLEGNAVKQAAYAAAASAVVLVVWALFKTFVLKS